MTIRVLYYSIHYCQKCTQSANQNLEEHLTLKHQRIEWVRQHQCLGVWLDAGLTFHKQVEYLRETSATLAPMRHITSLSGGANYHVLWAFYLHAIKLIIGYIAPTLANLTETQIRSLEMAQNSTLRLIFGAPMWTWICNLQMERNIPQLYLRILAINVRITAKVLNQLRDAPFAKVKIELCRNPNFRIPNTWIVGMEKSAKKCNLRKPSCLHKLYRERALEEEFPAKFNYVELPTSKANCTDQQLEQAAEEATRNVYTDGCIEYYNDRSVDNSIPETGAGVYSLNFTGSWGLPDTCSTLQTELIVILKPLE